jgi:HAD superfamily hydrolase (TIGR01509 family)
LLAALTARGVPWAIATSGYRVTAGHALGMLGLPEDAPMITRDMVRHAKPDPDLFLAAAALLGVDPRHAIVVGDSVWDLLAARRPAPCPAARSTQQSGSLRFVAARRPHASPW